MLAEMSTTPPRGKRRKSKLTQAGEATQRGLLLATLKAHGWNLSATAKDLEMAGSGDVVRSIKMLDLEEEYKAARERGEIRPRPGTKA